MNDRINSEQFAIKKAIDGDEEGYRYLLEKYKSFAFTVAIGIVKNNENAEEIVQDSFIKAFRNITKFRRSGKFSTWLYRIVYNTSLTSLRGSKLNLEPIKEHSHYILEIPDSYANGFEKLIRNDQVKYINKAISKLSEAENIVTLLYYTNECTIKEIHQITGWNISTIKTRLYRARNNLYVELSKLLKNEINQLK